MDHQNRPEAGDGAHARLKRKYRRLGVFAVALAVTSYVHELVAVNDVEPWLVRIILMLAGVLILDLLVRPILRRVVPTKIIVQFGDRDE